MTAEARQTASIGRYDNQVGRALDRLAKQAFARRLWERDAALWKQGAAGEEIIKNRLGWLEVVPTMMRRADDILRFADEVRAADFKYAVLMGMGGSSLSPEVSRLTFGVRKGYPDLRVLDSTVPAAILEIERHVDPTSTLFVVSTKAGTTVETLSAYRYFFNRVRSLKAERAGDNFVAITDPGTALEEEARSVNFRRVFLNFPDIGGRYSALSYFGLVPAALIGADIKGLLERARQMMESCGPDVSPPDNPGVALGAVIAELAMIDRDKLTLILSSEIQSFGCWVEQLVAESTGKNGNGIVPIEGESVGAPEHYGDDRLFVYLSLKTRKHEDLDAKVRALESAGQPVVRIYLDDVCDLGREYFRWEVATATASALLGVNPFDEPNVRESKDNTNRLLDDFKESGRLPEDKPLLDEGNIKLYCDAETQAVLDKIRAAGSSKDVSLRSYLKAHLNQCRPGDYFALMGFVHTSPAVDAILQSMRAHLRNAYKAPTTLGYGPRFLHSTGQLHKGGPNNGVFIQFTADDAEDVPIPGEAFGFGILKQAQAIGDAVSLRSKGRRLIRLHLGRDVEAGLKRVLDLIRTAVPP